MRRAFSVLYAIVIMLLVSGLLSLAMRYMRVSAKYISDSYIAEQSRILIKSAIEKTLLEISAHNRGDDPSSWDCFTGDEFEWKPKSGIEYRCRVRVVRYYLKDANCSNVDTISITNEKSHGMALFEIEMNASKDNELISRVIRRSLQHP